MMWSIYPVDESCELAARQTVTCGGAVFTFLHLPEAEGVISFLDALGDLKPAGWHSFYPRPDTGIATRCCLAEGTMTDETFTWIERLNSDGVFTLPLADLACPEFLGEHRLHREDTGISWRIDGTRGRGIPRSRCRVASGWIPPNRHPGPESRQSSSHDQRRTPRLRVGESWQSGRFLCRSGNASQRWNAG